MRVYLTGARGQLGASLLKEFQASDLEVLPFDRSLGLEQISEPGAVIHAGAVHPRTQPAPTKDDYQLHNIEFSRKLIDHAIEVGCRHFIFISTYYLEQGDPGDNIYAHSKLETEKYLAEKSDCFKASMSLRLPMIVTPSNPEKSFLSGLARKIRLKQSYTLTGGEKEFPVVGPEQVAAEVNDFLKGRDPQKYQQKVLCSQPILTLSALVDNLEMNEIQSHLKMTQTGIILEGLMKVEQ